MGRKVNANRAGRVTQNWTRTRPNSRPMAQQANLTNTQEMRRYLMREITPHLHQIQFN